MNLNQIRMLSLAGLALLVATAVAAQDDYLPGPDSQVQPGVPKGEMITFIFDRSKIFPGTVRTCQVYVPAQYTPDHPACLYVGQDGVVWNATVVFDNLIAKREMPVTIGVFVSAGIVESTPPKTPLGRSNRTYEYSSMNDDYIRFLLDELIPAVEARKTSDRRPIRFSREAKDRAIAGSSAGATCAFTAAWERPDAFSRVFSSVGGYGLYGGESYPTLIRKFEPKPIRIFLQDGSNDNGGFAGDWWMANQTMARALEYSGYEVQHVWGDGGHTTKHATAIFPDAMRWLWKDWPQPVKAGTTRNDLLNAILIPGEGWQLVGEGYKSTDGAAANNRGEVFFNDVGASRTYRIGLDGKVTLFVADARKAGGASFGPDGRLYAVSMEAPQLTAYSPSGAPTVVAAGIAGGDIVVAHSGNIYFTGPAPALGGAPSNLWLIKPNGEQQIVDTGTVRDASGIALSPDQSMLFVADGGSHWVYRYVILPDGTLRDRQRYVRLHAADGDGQRSADGIRADRDGRLYVATDLGIQICAQAALVNAIIPTPNRKVADLCFGGANFDTIFALCGDKVFRRRLRVRGANAWDVPNKPAEKL